VFDLVAGWRMMMRRQQQQQLQQQEELPAVLYYPF
jgi:hypothetical protein